jgi:hypothetical protein
MSMLPLLIGSLVSVGCLTAAFVCLRRKRIIDDLPTSKTQGVFIGISELKGNAESETPLTSSLGSVRCVWYEWKVEERWSRTITETYAEANGRSGLRTRTESGWTVVASGGENPPLYLKDDTGVLRIVPEGAEVHGVSTFDRTCGAGDPLYFAKGPLGAIANSTHQRRFKENALPLHAMLYVIGQAREREDVVAAEIARDKRAPIFVISTRTEKQLSSAYIWWILLWLILGLLVALGGAFISRAINILVSSASWQPLTIALGVYLIALTAGWTLTVYNSLITLRNRVNQAWSQVDIQLKRRADLIPNLVKCVESYSTHEKAVQEMVDNLRYQVVTSTRGDTLKGYSQALLAVAERYPSLKADRSFMALQKSLADTEGRIALARGYFNDIVTFYNTRLEVIPDRFVGRLARLFRQNLLQSTDLERASIDVHLVS